MRGFAGNATTEAFVESDNEEASLDQPESWSDLGDNTRTLLDLIIQLREYFAFDEQNVKRAALQTDRFLRIP